MEVIAAFGWIVAALLFGLYWGERARRQDAQLREGKLPVGRTKRAKVLPPSDAPEPAGDIADARQRYIDQAVAEGFAPEEAAADFDRMWSQISTDRPVTWDPSV